MKLTEKLHYKISVMFAADDGFKRTELCHYETLEEYVEQAVAILRKTGIAGTISSVHVCNGIQDDTYMVRAPTVHFRGCAGEDTMGRIYKEAAAWMDALRKDKNIRRIFGEYTTKEELAEVGEDMVERMLLHSKAADACKEEILRLADVVVSLPPVEHRYWVGCERPDGEPDRFERVDSLTDTSVGTTKLGVTASGAYIIGNSTYDRKFFAELTLEPSTKERFDEAVATLMDKLS